MQKVIVLILIHYLSFNLIAQDTFLPTTVKEEGHGSHIHPKIKGVWKSVGGGYILDASTHKFKLYNYTDRYCHLETDDYRTNLLDTSALFTLHEGKNVVSIYLHDFGEMSGRLQSSQDFVRLQKLPGNCSALSEEQQNNPEFLFDLFWHTLRENYAFSKERKLNWQELYQTYRPQFTSRTTKDELHRIMGEVVKLTKDQHTKIIYEGRTIQYADVPSALLLREAFGQQNKVKDFNEYINQFWQANYRGISKDLLKGAGKKVANDKIEWGHLSADIGYIHVHSLTGFASSETPRKQHVETLNLCMEQIMEAFREKKAIIIDISFNFGGYDAAGLTIASYFTDKPVHAYTKYTYHNTSLHKTAEVYVTPAKKYRFTKPVYVLTTDISRSAAETFAMQMKALPNVKTVGGNTLGILSDMLGKSIGHYYLTLSNQRYVSPAGSMYEVTGVDADIPVKVFSKDNMFNGHREAVQKIVELLKQ